MGDDEKHLDGTNGEEAEALFGRFLAAIGANVPDPMSLLGVTLVVHVEPLDGFPQARRHDLIQVCRRGFRIELLHDAALCIAEALEDDKDPGDPSQN